ncbi:MAG: NAD-dependent epimerase/dehydratase family protein [Salinarimonas sp.]|nr:NAD-dependent epimerase/dehydratase family protein [Salinarimonas sp.]
MRVLITGAFGLIGRRLTREIISRGSLTDSAGRAHAIKELLLVDRAVPSALPAAPFAVTARAGDMCGEGFLVEIMAFRADSIFHLAASLTVEAERDLALGWAANLHLPLRMLEALRLGEQRAKFIYTSSIAVFGGDLPAVVADDHVQNPQTSYGTAKAMTERLLHDYSRHGFVDARSLRLPIVVIRPGAPTGAVSDLISALAREPLAGRGVTAPLEAETPFPIVSVGQAARNLVALHDAPQSAFPGSRAVNQPALSVSVADFVDALARIAGEDAARRVNVAPDPAITRIVAGWPRGFVTRHALGEIITADDSLDTILAAYIAETQA